MATAKRFFTIMFTIFAIYLLIVYWFFSFSPGTLSTDIETSNFQINSTSLTSMQFYNNLRYTSSNISYKIYNCQLAKENEMENAFEIIENQTILNFYNVDSNEEISITCDSKNKIKEGMFIGGEGGPTNITKTDNFNVIEHGNILLLRETKCSQPNIALHELLHALGFDHSENPNNIMYPVVKCPQTMGEDIPSVINELYAYETLPDLMLQNVHAFMDGRFLNLNFTIRNYGLKDSENGTIVIYADEDIIKKLEIKPLRIGTGRSITINNIFISKINLKSVKIYVGYDGKELTKNNNQIIFQIKK